MKKMLVITDDLTGALDVGAELADKKITTVVLTQPEAHLEAFADTCQVLIVNAETRHLKYREAYQTVYRLTQQGRRLGIRYIYKKTDSALRGNLGSELEAVLTASGEPVLHFAPAFPQMGRTTRQGVQYIGGVPLGDSFFAGDPLDPVKESYIPDIIRKQSRIPVLTEREEQPEPFIRLYDAQTEGELHTIARDLLDCAPEAIALAGCAGFMEALSNNLLVTVAHQAEGLFAGPLLIVCGSTHQTSKAQIEYARKSGLARLRMESSRIVGKNYWESTEGKDTLVKMAAVIQKGESLIVESVFSTRDTGAAGRKVSALLPGALGEMITCLLASRLKMTLMVIGGDTLSGFTRTAGMNRLWPYAKLMPGVVHAKARFEEEMIDLITKAGSFGSVDLITRLVQNGRLS